MVTRRALVPVLFLMVIFVATAVLAGCETPMEEAVEQVEVIERKADTTAREANLRMIDSAVQMYYTEEGVYPSNISQLVPSYFSEIPTDSAGGTYYLVKEGATVKAAVK
ncbi:MAG: hypothetical protein KKB90_11095 [Actinobacteria bacterium]|nr:hypothetical protein [Actinomycetota bacterium]MCG2818933.1 hypothetical protein [Actinomycetes bacterium]MBU4179813.1 hypothetical protein [Actinomycetota bacterium]MBU4219493.1 hypothetical protein [Actinomycetota bacterium]MBU4359147.1 hypothetical protein [Actinomycetota bacterium]